jgi:hypothetical protein
MWSCGNIIQSGTSELSLRTVHITCVECKRLFGCKRASGKTAVPELFSAEFTTVRVTACLTWPIGPLFESAAKENSIVVKVSSLLIQPHLFLFASKPAKRIARQHGQSTHQGTWTMRGQAPPWHRPPLSHHFDSANPFCIISSPCFS